MRRIVLAVALVVLTASSAAAQLASNIVQVDLQIFAPGVSTVTGSPVSATSYLVALFTCNQVAPTVPATVTNPTRFFFDDVTNPGKVCLGTLVSSILPALPNTSGYLATVTVTDTTGQTAARSAASNPFGTVAAPTVRTGLKVL